MLEYVATHLAQVFYSLGGLLLVLELVFLGVSGPVLFIALGCLWTGLLVHLGIISSPIAAAAVAASASLTSAVMLWRPLKRWQGNSVPSETSSDMVGKVLVVTAQITAIDGRVSYSGIDWLAALAADEVKPLPVGDRVQVVSVEGTLLRVKAVAEEAVN